MFDIGWQELFVLAVLAIIVVGPKDLPRAIRTVTYWIRKARGMARDLQDGIDDVVREAELEDIKKEANKIMDGDGFSPTDTLAKEFDLTDVQQDWSEAVEDLKKTTDPNAKPGGAEDEKDEEVDEMLDDFAELDIDDDPELYEEPEYSTDTAESTNPEAEDLGAEMPETVAETVPEPEPEKAKG